VCVLIRYELCYFYRLLRHKRQHEHIQIRQYKRIELRLLTRFCKLLTRVAILSWGGTCLKCLNGTTPLLNTTINSCVFVFTCVNLLHSDSNK